MTEIQDLPSDFSESLKELGNMEDAAEIIAASFPTFSTTKQDARSIQRLLDLVAQVEKMEKERGTAKWFEHPYHISTLPKHKAFFDATSAYNEVLFLAGNR
jgi:hypothetical protein